MVAARFNRTCVKLTAALQGVEKVGGRGRVRTYDPLGVNEVGEPERPANTGGARQIAREQERNTEGVAVH